MYVLIILLLFMFVIGSVYMYTTPDNGVTWSETQKLLASDGAGDNLFGRMVSLYSDKLAVGAYGDDTEKGVNSGEIWCDLSMEALFEY